MDLQSNRPNSNSIPPFIFGSIREIGGRASFFTPSLRKGKWTKERGKENHWSLPSLFSFFWPCHYFALFSFLSRWVFKRIRCMRGRYSKRPFTKPQGLTWLVRALGSNLIFTVHHTHAEWTTDPSYPVPPPTPAKLSPVTITAFNCAGKPFRSEWGSFFVRGGGGVCQWASKISKEIVLFFSCPFFGGTCNFVQINPGRNWHHRAVLYTT